MIGILIFPAIAMAQSGLGSITGHVSDSTGAAIPGAKVTVTNIATGISIDTSTNGSGIYLVQQLNPGQYRVEAIAPRFKTTVRDGLTLDVDANLGIDLKLQVGASSETVTVTAAAPLLRNEDAETGEVIDNSVVENFPNLNGLGEVRNVLQALQYSGDIQGSFNSNGVAGANAGINHGQYSFSNLRVNGGRTSNTEYLVDGIPITQNMDRQLSPTVPTIEDTSEFKVVTGGMSAEYGHLSGGAIDIATQSGTKALHGSFFDFSQSKILNANTWDNNSTIVNGLPTPRAGFHQNDFGFNIGGPVVLPRVYNGREKTFWFFNYEGSRFSKGGAGNLTLSSVLTPQERTGDVSDMGVASNLPGCDNFGPTSTGAPCNNYPQPHMYDPYQTSTYPNQVCSDGSGHTGSACTVDMAYQHLTLLPNNGTLIPPGYLSPIIQQYLKYLMPLPTPGLNPVPNTRTGNNFSEAQNDIRSTDTYNIRIDENFNDRNRMFARFVHNNAVKTQTSTFGPNNPSYINKNPNGFGLTLGYDYTFTPTLLLNARVGGNYAPNAAGSFYPSNVNISNFGFDAPTLALVTQGGMVLPPIAGPWTEVNNTSANQVWGGNGTFPSAGTTALESTNYVYSVSLTKILGRHTLQFGYEGRRYYDNFQNSAEQTPSQAGQGYRFVSQSANQYSDQNSQTDWSPQGHANGVGDFLMGLYAWGQNNSGFTNTIRQNYYAAYAQDDFKASPNLTLNLGLRWETESPVSTNKNGILTVWDPNAPSPFTLASGWSWANDVVANVPSNLQGNLVEPQWATEGKFPNGALEFVGTPQHPSMNANDWHPYNFSPRLGAAWRVRNNMTIRGAGGVFYLPTGGSLNGYSSTSGVAYTGQDGNTEHNVQTTGIDLFQTYETGQALPANLHPVNGDPNCGCIESPTPAGQNLPATQHTNASTVNLLLNAQSANYGWVGAVNTKSHMPFEYDWNLGLQYEAKHGFLFEVVYHGNHSNTLLSKDNPGHFPAQLYTGGPGGANQTIYANTTVPSPLAPTVPSASGPTLPGGYAGPTTAIGYLEYGTPYFGELEITNSNIGRSLFNALDLRLEHRLKDGLQILANYTISRSMDNVGGPEVGQGNPGVGGQGAKTPADYQSIRDIYGLSALDEPRRLSVIGLYQIPLGRGRKWMNQHSTLGSSIVDYVAGGWNVTGTFVTVPGGPIQFTSASQASTDSSALHFHNVFGSYAPGATESTLRNSHWRKPKDSVYNGELQSSSVATPAFDFTQFVDAKSFTSTSDTRILPVIYTKLRNPDNWYSDLGLSKNLPLFSADGARYLQIRMDATDWLNHPGLGSYDTNLGDGPTQFGTINKFSTFEGPRNIALGARIVF